jgi:hypothetical protein
VSDRIRIDFEDFEVSGAYGPSKQYGPGALFQAISFKSGS